jgi:RNA 2',3'-cyclic 3'-phosphodiesterase
MIKRLFIAIPYIPSQDVLSVIQQLKTGTINDKINWVQPGNMHLTLKFLGDTDVKDIAKISTGLSEIANHYSVFEMKVIGFEMFYRGKHPSVIYLNLDKNETCAQLAKEVNDFCDRLNIGEKGNSYKAHITVARIKYMTLNETFMKTLSKTFNHPFPVSGFELIESQLTTSGPIYRTVEHFQLNH